MKVVIAPDKFKGSLDGGTDEPVDGAVSGVAVGSCPWVDSSMSASVTRGGVRQQPGRAQPLRPAALVGLF